MMVPPVVGYDLDGVVVRDPSRIERATLYRWQRWVSWRQLHRRVRWRPEPGACVITGRPACDRETTLAWAQRVQLGVPVFFVGRAELPVLGKARIINRLRLQVYVESDRDQAEQLRQLCPQTKVVEV